MLAVIHKEKSVSTAVMLFVDLIVTVGELYE